MVILISIFPHDCRQCSEPQLLFSWLQDHKKVCQHPAACWTVAHRLAKCFVAEPWCKPQVWQQSIFNSLDSLGCSLPESRRASCSFSGVHEDKAVLSGLVDARTPSFLKEKDVLSGPPFNSFQQETVSQTSFSVFCSVKLCSEEVLILGELGSLSPHFSCGEKCEKAAWTWTYMLGSLAVVLALPKLTSSSAGPGGQGHVLPPAWL